MTDRPTDPSIDRPEAAPPEARDPNRIYPRPHPHSPWICLLNLLVLPGMAQIALGQSGKGALWFGLSLPPVALTLAALIVALAEYFGANDGGAAMTWGIVAGLAFLAALAVLLAATLDAWRVAQALRAGRPVGRWEFFPSP
jgi:hypothetical protein